MTGQNVVEQAREGRTRHREIQEDYVDRCARERSPEPRTVCGFADHLHVRLHRDDLAQARPHHRMIVRDDDPDHATAPGLPWPKGMHAVTDVPPCGAAHTPTSPPQESARSRMPSNPKEWASTLSLSVIPRPLPCTSRTTSHGVSRRRMSTWVAPAWRARLVRASWRMRTRSVERSSSTQICSAGL